MNNPKVSIVIPVYNGSNFLVDAIESALGQTYENIEVIVVNDGSDDNGATKCVASKFGNRIKYIDKENGGVASALNVGISEMTGDYFAWLSHDDLFTPRKIEAQLCAIKRTFKSESIAFDNYALLNVSTGKKSETRMSAFFEESELRKSIFPFLLFELHFSSLLIHKSILNSVGGFRQDLLTSQDNDMIFRLLKGRTLAFSDEIGSIVRLHDHSGTARNHNLVDTENSQLYLSFAKNIKKDEAANIFGCAGSFYSKIGGIIKSMKGDNELKELEGIWKSNCQDELSTGVKDYSESKDNFFGNRRIIIYGAGEYGLRLKYELNSREIQPLCFIDQSKSKQNTYIDGVPCYSPAEFQTMGYYVKENALLINSVKAYADAEETIEKLGVKSSIRKDEADAKIIKMQPTCIPVREGGQNSYEMDK